MQKEIEVIPYRIGTEPEYLGLKSREGSWEVPKRKFNKRHGFSNETVDKTLDRSGLRRIDEPILLNSRLYSIDIGNGNRKMVSAALYGVRVDPYTDVVMIDRHIEWKWFDYEKALTSYSYRSVKDSLVRLNDRVITKGILA